MQKTLQEYSTIAKLLKLDILRVKMDSQEISKKLGDKAPQAQTHQNVGADLAANKDPLAVIYVDMQLLKGQLDRVGLSPEMFYRICDEKRKKIIKVDDFIKQAAQVKMNIPKERFDRICLNFDEKKNGTIELDSYLANLSAFQIATEPYPESSKVGYAQTCLNKLAMLCKQDSIDLKMIDSDKPIDYSDFRKLIQKDVREILNVELTAIYISYDKGKQFRIPTDAIYKRLTEEIKEAKPLKRKVPFDSDLKEQSKLAVDADPRSKVETDPKPTKNNFDSDKENRNNDSRKGIQRPQSKTSNGVLDFAALFTVALRTASNGTSQTPLLQRSFTVNQAKSIISNAAKSKQLSGADTFAIFRKIDSNQKGTITVLDMCNFFIKNKQPKDSHTPIFLAMAACISYNNETPELFLQRYGVTKDSKIKLPKFVEIFSELNWSEKELQPIYNQIKESEGTLSSGKLIALLRRYGEFQELGKEVQPSSQPKTTGSVLTELKDFEELVKKLPKPNQNGTALKKQLSLKPSQLPKWKTIFRDEVEAMRFCYGAMKQVISKRRESKSSTYNWDDPEFGARQSDPHGWNSINQDTSNKMSFLPKESDVEWMHIKQYLRLLSEKTKKKLSKPYFIHSDMKMNDIIPSSGLNNRWFVTALGFLTSYRNLIIGSKLDAPTGQTGQAVYPTLFQTFGKYGIYTFKFYKQNQPVYVVVDDTLPVNINILEPLFSHSNDPACMWAILIEKAYAKLHYSYSNIQSGQIVGALSDLTGFTCLKQPLVSLKQGSQTDNWKIQVETKMRKGYLLGCSSQSSRSGRQKNGISEQSLYAVLHLIEIPDANKDNSGRPYNLLCIRNPQPNSQWKGEWSEAEVKEIGKQAKLSKHIKLIEDTFKIKNDQLKKAREDTVQPYTIKEGDSTFLMELSDWTNNFDTVYWIIPNSPQTKRIRTKEVWGPVMQSGLPKPQSAAQSFYKVNFSYKVEVVQPDEVIVELSQQDGRLVQGLTYPYDKVMVPLSIVVIRAETGKLPERYSEKDNIATHPPEIKGSVALRFRAEKGIYFVIPCTQAREDKKPYPEFTLDIVFGAGSIKYPGTFREVDIPKKLDSSIDAFSNKLASFEKEDDNTYNS